MSTTVPDAFSILDIARRINAASVEYDIVDTAQYALSDLSAEYRKGKVKMDRLLDERLALQDLAISLHPKTLAEAAVQLGLLFYGMDTALDTDDIDEMRAEVKKIERTTAGIVRVMASAANVDLAHFGGLDLVRIMDLRSPEPVNGDAA